MTRSHPAAPVLPADVVVFDEALVDLLPGERGVPLDEVERFRRHLGGAGANLAVGLARLKVRTALVGLVGGDPLGRFVTRYLAEEGVVTDGLGQHRSARTGLCFLSIGPRGERSFLAYRQPSADLLVSPGDLQPEHITRGRLLCLGSALLSQEPARAATLRALELAQGRKLLIFCDLNYRPHLWRDTREAPGLLRRLLMASDIARLTEEELLPLLGTEQVEAAAARLRQLGPTLVVITLGARGCYVDCPAGQSYLFGEPPPGPVIDETGAGDAFSAGLIAELLAAIGGRTQGDQRARLAALGMAQVKAACARGNHLGAVTTTILGGT
jgi:fructokinase